MEAQTIIVRALQAQVGGTGTDVAKDSLAGKLDTAGQLWSEFSGKLAASTGTMTLTEQLINGMVITLGQLNAALEPEATTDLFQKRLDIMMQIAGLENRIEAGGDTAATGRLKARLAGLQKQADALFGDITGQASKANEESLRASDAHEKSQLKIKQDGLALQATAEEDYRNNQILAELVFLEKREAFAIEQAKKIADMNRKAFIDDAEMGMAFAKLKADNDKKVAGEKEKQQKEQLTALGDLTTNLGAVLGEQNALFKASAITQAIINTHNAATGAYAALAPIPIIGPALGGAAAGVALAAGFKNVQAIASAREQGGTLAPGQSSTIAERGKLEIITPQNATRVQTANQMRSIMGEQGGGNNVTLNVIDQSSGSKEFTQETKSDGEIILLIRNTVSADIATSNTQIDKSLSGRGQARQRA
jgi:hypothetical protein